MSFPRLLAAAVGLLLPLAAVSAEASAAAPSRAVSVLTAPVVTVAEQSASVHYVARHYRHHHRHHRSYRHGRRG